MSRDEEPQHDLQILLVEDNPDHIEIIRRAFKAKYPNIPLDLFSEEMYKINSFIWVLEAALKSGKEHLPNPHYLDDEINISSLAPIGKNSILIRNINTFRVGLKNIINKMTGEGFQDHKSKHLSE